MRIGDCVERAAQVNAEGIATRFGSRARTWAEVRRVPGRRAAVARAGVPAKRVDQVLVGCTHQGGDQSFNIGRNGWLAAGLPDAVPASTVDTQCGSSQQAVNLAAALVASGEAEVVVAAGVESLTRVPMFSTKAVGEGEPYPATSEFVTRCLTREWLLKGPRASTASAAPPRTPGGLVAISELTPHGGRAGSLRKSC